MPSSRIFVILAFTVRSMVELGVTSEVREEIYSYTYLLVVVLPVRKLSFPH